jgi:CubicO group peptidase (beta-lactamase class C family)
MRASTRAILLCLASSASFAQAQPSPPSGPAQAGETLPLPDTPAGKQLGAFLKAFNTGDRETIRSFVATDFGRPAPGRPSVDAMTDVNLGLYEATHGFDLRKTDVFSPQDVRAIAQARLTGVWMEIRMHVAARPPHVVESQAMFPVPAPVDLLPRRKLTEIEVCEKLDDLIKKLASVDGFSGTVLVAKDGKPLYENACGLASRAWNQPNRIETRFNLGSMNKMFTAVAVAQLVEQGKLSYDETAGKLLPDCPNQELAQKVTVHHLLTHTSGLGNFFNDKFEASSRLRFRAIRDFFALFVDDQLQFEPGAKFAYSNAGFIVLGAIIERVSGEDYFDYVREHIYKPAGMTDTDCFDVDTDPPNVATGYTKRNAPPGTLRTNTFLHVVKGGPSGGGYSTVGDLFKFDVALRTHKLLSAKSTDAVWSGKVKFGPPGSEYGYGFMDARYNGSRIVGHSGGFAGISSQLDMYLDLGYTVAVMSNYDFAAEPVALKLREWLTQGLP